MMKLTIRFYPDSDTEKLVKNALEYQDIWKREGERIINSLEKQSGLQFTEGHINAIVIYGLSNAIPLVVTSTKTENPKITTLLHELCRRLLIEHGKSIETKVDKLILIDLILYEVFQELYGVQFLNECIKRESKEYLPKYSEAWEHVQNLSKEERTEKITNLLNINS